MFPFLKTEPKRPSMASWTFMIVILQYLGNYDTRGVKIDMKK
jgi:hypothetical protein